MTRRPAQTLTTMTKTRSRGSKIKLILNAKKTIFVFFWSWIQLNGSIRDMGWKSGGIRKFFRTKKGFYHPHSFFRFFRYDLFNSNKHGTRCAGEHFGLFFKTQFSFYNFFKTR
jgi:hypothetical protein